MFTGTCIVPQTANEIVGRVCTKPARKIFSPKTRAGGRNPNVVTLHTNGHGARGETSAGAGCRHPMVVSCLRPLAPVQGRPLARTTKLDQTGDARVPRVR